ncbi:MAG TPA: oligosaccharide flippase family protein [Spirochaetales bacterium]|nr:oligosaccharide flippase family protein [Spirochaetales bacterium]
MLPTINTEVQDYSVLSPDSGSITRSNTKRIARNTLMLYFRQILIMLVSLYTVRVVLHTLGAVDYGIYNVVAGIVTMFSFLSGAMATASQRYFSYDLGRGDPEQLQKTFSVSLTIYIILALCIVAVAETVGLWFVYNKLVVPVERVHAARWIYQASVFSFVCTMITTPFMAAIIAHEDMDIYAYVSILEAGLKLGIVFLLPLFAVDKLIFYGLLLALAVVITTTVYWAICRKKYEECRTKLYWDKKLFRELLSYTGWNTFGAAVGVFKFQAVNILLNQCFNPIVVAARGIASQVNSAVNSFAQSFSTAVRPQIIKSYAAGDIHGMILLVYRSCKTTFFLMYVFALPLIIEMQYVLTLWLKNPPNYTVIFTQLALFDVVIDSVNYPLMTTAQATGKVKLYQSVVGGILLLNLPLSFVMIASGFGPTSVFIVAILLTFVAFFVRLFILKRLVPFSILIFLGQVFVPLVVVAIISALFPMYVHHLMAVGFTRLILVCVASVCSVGFFAFFIALPKSEKQYVLEILKRKIGK